MAEVKVLFKGIHDRIEEGVKVGSTSVLIKTDKNIVVDTGSFVDKQKLIDSLEREGLKPEDINIVILTHLHIDHIINANIFPKALVYTKHNTTHPGIVMRTNSDLVNSVDLDNFEVAKDVRTISANGHFPFGLAVVVNTDNGVVVIAGDAIASEKLMDTSIKPSPFTSNMEEYEKTRKNILEIADYVITGHSGMIKVEK